MISALLPLSTPTADHTEYPVRRTTFRITRKGLLDQTLCLIDQGQVVARTSIQKPELGVCQLNKRLCKCRIGS